MRVLLDTNVILDFVLSRQPFFTEADEIFVKLQNSEFEAYVSAITPINVFYTTRKEKGKATAFSAVEELLKLVRITKSNNHIFQTPFSSRSTTMNMPCSTNALRLKIPTR
jgi:predicted nucleic acid-binding protein